MPRPAKGARLYFSERDGYWYIRDGATKRGTGCALHDSGGAEQALSRYLAQKHTPDFGKGDPSRVGVLDVLILYGQERGPNTERPDIVRSALRSLGPWWNGKKCSDVTPGNCQAYVDWRTAQPQARYKDKATAPKVGDQTARRELDVLKAALGYAFKARKLNYPIPVTLPAKAPPRDRWLSRNEVARLVWAAWRQDQGRSRHIARFILLSLYTGTRYQAALGLRWMPSTVGGWADLERGIIYRKGSGQRETSKRRTPVPISDRLATHLRRWKRLSSTHVIEYAGLPVGQIKTGWKSARIDAGLGPDVTIHILRHTFATWAVQDGVPLNKVAAALGTTERMVESVYGHHAPERLAEVVNAVSKRRD